jgi:aromatic ring-opening dioxygenase catalytic subunit (LigB family)
MQDFDDWLVNACTQHRGRAREGLLERWSSAPGARFAHPREEHLLPLMVVAAAAGEAEGAAVYRDPLLGGAVTGFAFG